MFETIKRNTKRQIENDEKKIRVMRKHGFTDGEIVLSCSDRAEELYEEIAEHHWHKEGDPKRHGYYLKDGSGTIQGHIC